MPYRIAWDVSHREFTIEDGYYFSKLLSVLREIGAEVIVTEELKEAEDADTLVLNYPEEEFTSEDISFIKGFLSKGRRVVALAYYNNEDQVGAILNDLANAFGIEILFDAVKEKVNFTGDDPYMVVTSKVFMYNKGVKRVLMPYSSSLRPLSPDISVIVQGEPTAQTTSGNRPILGCETRVGKGRFLCLGTCVFWDNYSIEKFDNLAFALNILGP